MAGIRELRGRIKSVGNIKQITRAMEMVATTKLRRFQDRATSSRPYAEEITGLVGRLAAVLGEGVEDKPLFQPGGGDKTLALVVSSDRGLCGAYNSNLLRMVEGWRAEHPRPIEYGLAHLGSGQVSAPQVGRQKAGPLGARQPILHNEDWGRSRCRSTRHGQPSRQPPRADLWPDHRRG